MRLRTLCALQALSGFASQVTSPLQSAYALAPLGLSTAEFGVSAAALGAAYVVAIACVLACAPTPYSVLRAALLVRVPASLAYAGARASPMAMLTLSRAAHGASLASVTACFQLAAARPHDPDEASRLLVLCLMLGPLAGMACASALAATTPLHVAIDASSWLSVAAAVAAVVAVGGAANDDGPSTEAPPRTPTSHGAPASVLLVATNVGFGTLTLESLAPLIAHRALGVPAAHVGLVVLPLMSAIVLAQTAALRLGRRVSGTALALAVGAALTGGAALPVSMALLCASGGLQMSWCTARASGSPRGVAYAQMATQLGRCAGPLVGGALFEDVSARRYWALQLVATAVAGVVAYAFDGCESPRALL